jgi:WD40 repeat protein
MALINHLAVALLLSSFHTKIAAFVPGQTHSFVGRRQNHPSAHEQINKNNICPGKRCTYPLKKSVFDDFEEFELSDESYSAASGQVADIYASLKSRQDHLDSSAGSISGGIVGYNKNHEIASNWKDAECFSSIRLQLSDWIRRIAVDTYPLAVCGSAKGNIYLADLDRAEELDCITSVHEAEIDDEDVTEAMKKMYGLYDGGGVISIAIHNDIVVSSGREGGVHVFKIDGEEESYYEGSRGGSKTSTKLHLKSEGKIRPLDSTLVTSLAFDKDGMLWTGGYDGIIRAFEYDNQDVPLALQKEAEYELDVGTEVLSLTVNNEIGCGVAATAGGTALLFSLEEGDIMAEWKPFGRGIGKRKREYARCAIIVQNDEESTTDNGEKQNAVWSVICGGSEGSMYQKRLNVDSLGYVSDTKPFVNDESLRGRLRPSHSSIVMTFASPSPGILVSGSQDGTIRIWDCSYYKSSKSVNPMVQEDQDDDDEEEALYDDIGVEDRRPDCLYAMTGYKMWLGSIFANADKLVTDGSDNTIVTHDFSGDDDNTEGFSFEDDDLEDFSL